MAVLEMSLCSCSLLNLQALATPLTLIRSFLTCNPLRYLAADGGPEEEARRGDG